MMIQTTACRKIKCTICSLVSTIDHPLGMIARPPEIAPATSRNVKVLASSNIMAIANSVALKRRPNPAGPGTELRICAFVPGRLREPARGWRLRHGEYADNQIDR